MKRVVRFFTWVLNAFLLIGIVLLVKAAIKSKDIGSDCSPFIWGSRRILSSSRFLLSLIISVVLFILIFRLPETEPIGAKVMSIILVIFAWFCLLKIIKRIYYSRCKNAKALRIRKIFLLYLSMTMAYAITYQCFNSERDEIDRPKTKRKKESVGRFVENCYFSAATITTVGYGDITPLSSSLRVIATSEMFAAILLVSIVLTNLPTKRR